MNVSAMYNGGARPAPSHDLRQVTVTGPADDMASTVQVTHDSRQGVPGHTGGVDVYA